MEMRHYPDPDRTIGLADEAAVRSSGTTALVEAAGARPSLTALEWQVVAAAFSDASGHACGRARKPSRLASGFRHLLEGSFPQELAASHVTGCRPGRRVPT
jgi:hypothetical protein